MGNEITVRIKNSIKEMNEILKRKGFKVKKEYILNDTFFVPKGLNLDELSVRESLSKAVILRDIEILIPNKERVCKLTFKKKEIDQLGNILKQEKVDCEILNLQNAKKFIEAIGYIEIMRIREKDVEYTNGEIEIATKDIENGDKLIEVEENERFDTIEKLKQKVKELELPIETDNYFVKKAEMELEKVKRSSMKN